MSCRPTISDDFVFPRRASNTPAQPRLDYRIGRCSDFLEAIVRAVDTAPELAAWTHRQPDDPAYALLEGAAILGDILSFYQEHYANEAYLRTAAWRESVAELVRLTGYRLAPGLGGRATLAFEARGSAAVTIRAGFPVKLELEDSSAPADFQTEAELVAWPHLSRFQLYAPRSFGIVIDAGASRVELASVAGATDSVSLAAAEFKAGDRLILVPDESVWSAGGGAYSPQATPQVVALAQVTRLLDRVVLDLEQPLVGDWSTPVRAWKLGRTFRHFGHNAPSQMVVPELDSAGKITGSLAYPVEFERDRLASAASPPAATGRVSSRTPSPPPSGDSSASARMMTATEAEAETRLDETLDDPRGGLGIIPLTHPNLPPRDFALEQEVGDLAIGGSLILQGLVSFDGQAIAVPFVLTRRAIAARATQTYWGNLSGPSTMLTLDGDLVQNESLTGLAIDIRELRIHELKSPALTLRPALKPAAGEITTGAGALTYYGSAAQVQAIAGRRLYLAHADGRSVELVCTNAAEDFPPALPDVARMWTLGFDRPPSPLRLEDFGEATPLVSAFGNLADASQGRAEREAVLGNGDARRLFQTFELPKAPLTYLLDPASTPPHVPELEIRVGGRIWTRVDALYGHGPEETIFIVREDAEGRSFVQFGDGETGARLPSGLKNVVAVYRSGSGARGALKPGTNPSASERPAGFDKVTLAGIVAGGADPEDLEIARAAAPGKVQSLGRLVSITDFASEALAVSGVLAAEASWDLHHGLPVILMRVLLEAGREAEFAAIEATLQTAQRCRGPDRESLVVEQALLRYAFVDLAYARDPSYPAGDVEQAIRAAFGLAGDAANASAGFFGERARRIGAPEYASRIEGRVQNVAGVSWCQVTALGLLAAGITDPAGAPLPAAPRPLAGVLACAPNELLQLASEHLTLTETAAPGGGCAP